MLVIIGICQGMQPIAGYNYGAGHTKRLKEVFWLTMKICVLTGFVGSFISCVFPRVLIRAFTSDPTLIEIAVPTTRFFMAMFALVGFTVTNSNFFQSIDKPWIAIVTSLSRQVIFLAPLSYIIPLFFEDFGIKGIVGVWSAITISDVLGAVLAGILLYSQRKIFSDSK